MFITLQLNCTNLCTAVCESKLGWAARTLFLGTQIPVLRVCVESKAVRSHTYQASGNEKSNFS